MNRQDVSAIGLVVQLFIIIILVAKLKRELKEARQHMGLWKGLCNIRAEVNQEINRQYLDIYHKYVPKWQWEEPIDPEAFAVWGPSMLSGINWPGSFSVPRLPGKPIFTLNLPLPLIIPDFTFKVGRDGITPVPKSAIEAKDGDMVQPKDGEQWLKDHKKDSDK